MDDLNYQRKCEKIIRDTIERLPPLVTHAKCSSILKQVWEVASRDNEWGRSKSTNKFWREFCLIRKEHLKAKYPDKYGPKPKKDLPGQKKMWNNG